MCSCRLPGGYHHGGAEPSDLTELAPVASPGQGISEENPDEGPDEAVLPIDPSLSPEILAAQLEHALHFSDSIQAGLAAAGTSCDHRRLSELEIEVAALVQAMCNHRIQG